MRILVVEDERVAAEVLAKGLREHAYAVDVGSDGIIALEQAGTNDYDLIILDILIPRINGLDVCSRLRADGLTVPILMLTARGAPDQRVQGLDAGADDGNLLDNAVRHTPPRCSRLDAEQARTRRRSPASSSRWCHRGSVDV
jgi:CheY-like chemotaxis protein